MRDAKIRIQTPRHHNAAGCSYNRNRIATAPFATPSPCGVTLKDTKNYKRNGANEEFEKYVTKVTKSTLNSLDKSHLNSYGWTQNES